ncbi:hypothetical protein WN51_03333 [Melipona quadrifasciata]|uniref:Uncharacterized protein n=1 Tax=Melipona quadrifasciata TaxID=166423 RepID=A0A0M8ZTN0_9HYME|nr:hypothetical protein WN51_03333 [Melipona quadrifasciata]
MKEKWNAYGTDFPQDEEKKKDSLTNTICPLISDGHSKYPKKEKSALDREFALTGQ